MYKQTPPLYQHQKKALSFIIPLDYWALFMEQGTGKSKVAIEKCLQLFEEGKINCIVIVSPKAVSAQWVKEEFVKHYPSDEWIGFLWSSALSKRKQKFFHESIKNKKKLFVFSVNVEAFQANEIGLYMSLLIEERSILMVIDESTRIKNGKRKPKKGVRGGAKSTNKLLDIGEKIIYKGILTGTPTPNNPFDLWSQFEFLKKNFFEMDLFYFTQYYGIMLKKKTANNKSYTVVMDKVTFDIIKSALNYGKEFEEQLTPQKVQGIAAYYGIDTQDLLKINKMDKYTPYKHLNELHSTISKITVFERKKDCLDLPDKVYEKLYCTMGPEQSKVYKSLQKDMFIKYEGKELNITNKLVMALRLQMITGGLFPYLETKMKVSSDGEEFLDTKYSYTKINDNGKIKCLMEDLEEVDKTTSIIIWARFRGEIDLICEALTNKGYTNGKYYGGESDLVLDLFKQRAIQVLVANPVKGGEGLNLQVATHVYYYSNSYQAHKRLQSEDRTHRIGQVNKVTYKDIICRHTLDEHIFLVLKKKENLIDYFRTKDPSIFWLTKEDSDYFLTEEDL